MSEETPPNTSESFEARIKRGLSTFWFGQTTGEAGALFRVGLGALVLWYLVVLVGWNLTRYYGDSGTYSFAAFSKSGGNFSVLSLSGSRVLLYATWGVSVLSALCFSIGIKARISAAVMYAGLLSFETRNPLIVSAAERLLLTFSFLSIFAPLSLKWVLLRKRPLESSASVFGLSMIRVQIVLVYFVTFVLKVREPIWRSGLAIGKAIRAPTVSRYVEGLGSDFLERCLTYGTLCIEALFFLVFWKKFRKWVLALGLLLHLSIEMFMIIPLFSSVMIVGYLAFLDDDEARGLVRALGRVCRVFGIKTRSAVV